MRRPSHPFNEQPTTTKMAAVTATGVLTALKTTAVAPITAELNSREGLAHDFLATRFPTSSLGGQLLFAFTYYCRFIIKSESSIASNS